MGLIETVLQHLPLATHNRKKSAAEAGAIGGAVRGGSLKSDVP